MRRRPTPRVPPLGPSPIVAGISKEETTEGKERLVRPTLLCPIHRRGGGLASRSRSRCWRHRTCCRPSADWYYFLRWWFVFGGSSNRGICAWCYNNMGGCVCDGLVCVVGRTLIGSINIGDDCDRHTPILGKKAIVMGGRVP